MKLKAELWDKIQYLFRNYYDRMMHAVIYLDAEIDIDILNKSLSIMIDKVPVVRSRYVSSKINPYWVVEEGHHFVDKACCFVESDDLDKDVDSFITSKFDSNETPQLRLNVFRNSGCDTLAFLVNHQCFDGADLKQFIYKLVEIYNDILSGGDGDIPVKNGSRANEQVYSSMSLEDSKKAKAMYKNISKTKHQIEFPFTSGIDHCKAMIVKHHIDCETFNKMQAYGKKYDSTINDVILSAYFRALYYLIHIEDNMRITIPCMTDLRRHIEGGETAGFTNLTCLIPCTIDSIGPTFSATLKKVHGEMDKHKKDRFVGLGGIPLLELAYNVAPSAAAELMIKTGYTNPYIGMSNIGIIDDKKLNWGKVSAKDAFMTGAIKYKPYMQLALTSFKKNLTLTICIYGTPSDRAIIEKFFRLFDEEIRSITE